ncbi:MAG: lantibiotic dehydratase [Myxococcota bacterium]
MSLTLAPGVIVRIAAWPADSLSGFGDPALLALAQALDGPVPSRRHREARKAHRAEEQRFQALYEASLSAEGERLRQRTAEDPRFMTALALSHPALFEAASALVRGEKRPKKARHLLGTLYRTLSRACRRTTPADAWSGVSLARFGAETEVRPGPRRLAIAPDLAWFQRWFRAVGHRPELRGECRVAINPTCFLFEGRAHRCFARTPEGAIAPRELGRSAIVDALLLGAAPASGRPPRFRTLVSEVARALDVPEARVETELLGLIHWGFLVGGLDLPTRFRTPWSAIERAGRRLTPPLRAALASAMRGLLSAAERAQDAFAASDPAAMRGAQSAAAEALLALGAASAVELPPPRAPLRADLFDSHAITIGPGWRASIEAAVLRYEDFQRDFGLGLGFRLDGAARRSAAIAGPFGLDALPWAEVLGAPLPGRSWESIAAGSPVVERRLEGWRQALAGQDFPKVSERTEAALPPLGTLLLLHGVGEDGAPRYRAHGLLDDATTPFARFSWAFSPARSGELLAFFRGGYRRAAEARGLRLFEYSSFAEAHPGAAATPGFLPRRFSPWTADPPRRALQRLRISPASLELDGAPAAVLAFGAANTLADPIARVLGWSGFRDGPALTAQASTIPFARELSPSTRRSPALALGSELVARSARGHLFGAELQGLLESRGPERFRRWLRSLRELGLEGWLEVRRLGDTGVIVHAASPLGVEAALEGVGPEDIVVLEVAPEPTTATLDASGQRYFMELAVPFARAEHAWYARGDQR